MFSVDDIPNNKRISNAIEVTITDVSLSDNSKIDYELTIEDSVGNTVAMNIWTTHDVDVSWTESHRYELTNVRGKVWTKNGQRHARLSSAKNLQVTDLGPVTGDTTRIFVIGDTHVGYANRKRKNRVPQYRDVDCEDSFRKAVEQATSRDVDAFVHTGISSMTKPAPVNSQPSRMQLVNSTELELRSTTSLGTMNLRQGRHSSTN